MVVGSIFGGGVGGVVGLLTFKGECSTQKNRLQILDLRRLASLHFCILNITLSFCQLYRILSEPPGNKYTYCGNFPVSVANVQKWAFSKMLKFEILPIYLSLQIQKCFSSSYDFCTVFAHTLYIVSTTEKALSWKQMLLSSVPHV